MFVGPEVSPRPFGDDASTGLVQWPFRYDKEVEVIRVLVVDDSAPVRLGLLALFASQHDLVVCGDARDGHAGVLMATTTSPDVVVMDLSMPGLDGLEATRQILEAAPHVRVVVLTGRSRARSEKAALEAGATVFVMKGDGPESLLAAVRAASPVT
ncbi:hypothetical protein ASD62_02370 [Phycicoccus sp. Root563]|uniref:response regulator n=1 Tax=unclassified Phycicoccus TaxID=2637926 RepID=UPI000702D025|nr:MULTISPECIES: response regulator transcription factor [unclassified Phycicoccus]KQU68847.1 hypothetical protein ASC58_09215 [Phycicoccus sp. Root101]KQZ88340.1 hypothetical protein ASD62_02370 [Phycicoccus sp. Root563]